jgi:hypothetical protein
MVDVNSFLAFAGESSRLTENLAMVMKNYSTSLI